MAAVLAMQRSKKNNEQQRPQPQKVARFLITVTVLGSAGPLRFVVKEEELVSAVMETALRSYAREGRYPVLGYDVNNFFLYCANAGSEGSSKKKNTIFFFLYISLCRLQGFDLDVGSMNLDSFLQLWVFGRQSDRTVAGILCCVRSRWWRKGDP